MTPATSQGERGKAMASQLLSVLAKRIGLDLSDVRWTPGRDRFDRGTWSLVFSVAHQERLVTISEDDLEGLLRDSRVRQRVANGLSQELEVLARDAVRRAGHGLDE
jgi:hypothetical protein